MYSLYNINGYVPVKLEPIFVKTVPFASHGPHLAPYIRKMTAMQILLLLILVLDKFSYLVTLESCSRIVYIIGLGNLYTELK